MSTAAIVEQLDVWTHSDFSRPALRYAVSLLSDDRAIKTPEVDIIGSRPNQKQLDEPTFVLPYSRTWVSPSGRAVRIRVEDSDVDALGSGSEWKMYDAFGFATISFEHIVNDMHVISRMPAGSAFVFSTATFPYGEHARHFRRSSRYAIATQRC